MEVWQRLQPVIDSLIPKVAQHGPNSLTPAERVVYLVWSYTGAVNNGGHASFFYNSYGQFATETVTRMRARGVH
jgi:hypothetical protein